MANYISLRLTAGDADVLALTVDEAMLRGVGGIFSMDDIKRLSRISEKFAVATGCAQAQTLRLTVRDAGVLYMAVDRALLRGSGGRFGSDDMMRLTRAAHRIAEALGTPEPTTAGA